MGTIVDAADAGREPIHEPTSDRRLSRFRELDEGNTRCGPEEQGSWAEGRVAPLSSGRPILQDASLSAGIAWRHCLFLQA
jgi:hypothetical protein